MSTPPVPLIKWYSNGGCLIRGHGLGEDVLYLCGDKEPRYLLPVDIGYVSIGRNYLGMVYIDSADEEDPEMIWYYEYVWRA